MFSYFSLREINNDLLKENSSLKNQVLNKDMVVGRKFIKSEELVIEKQFYSLIILAIWFEKNC